MLVYASSETPLRLDLHSIAIRLKLNATHKDTIDKIRHWLENNTRWLFILDNVSPGMNLTKYYPNNPKGLVLIVASHLLKPPDSRFVPINVDTMSSSESFEFFCTEFRLPRSEDPSDSSAISMNSDSQNLRLVLPEQSVDYLSKTKVEKFLDFLGYYALAITLGIGWIRSRMILRGNLDLCLDEFGKDFLANGKVTNILTESTTFDKLFRSLMKPSAPKDPQLWIELLEFLSVIDHSGLPMSLLEFCWKNIKRKRERNGDKTSEWTKERPMKLLRQNCDVEWSLHPIHDSVTHLISRCSETSGCA